MLSTRTQLATSDSHILITLSRPHRRIAAQLLGIDWGRLPERWLLRVAERGSEFYLRASAGFTDDPEQIYYAPIEYIDATHQYWQFVDPDDRLRLLAVLPCS